VRGFLSMQLPPGWQLLVPLGVSLLLALLLQLLKPLWARDLRA
jgi:hypothetical protein